MTDEEIKEFTRWLTAANGADCQIALCMPANGKWYGYKRLLFHWTIVSGDIGNKDEIEDRWCYATSDRVMLAFTEWAARKFEGEPEGWHRHPKTGRRRPDGDKTKEHIAG